MAIEVNQVYKTQNGKFLKVVAVKDSGFHHFQEVSDNVKQTPILERRNKLGHVTHRVKLVYGEEVISTFRKMQKL